MIALVLEDGVAVVQVGPFVSLACTNDVITAYYDDGASEVVLRMPTTEKWLNDGRLFERVVIVAWPSGTVGS